MLITGTFLDEISHDIPHQNWSRREWDADFAHMKRMGIDTLILIRSGYKRWLTYPSEYLMEAEGCFRPPVDLVRQFLELAGKYGMAFYFGLYDSGKYWWEQGNYQKEVDINLRVIDEVWKNYGWMPSFKGWYLSQEVSRRTGSITGLYRRLGEHCKGVSGGLPTLISPYIDGTKAILSSQPSLSREQAITLEEHEREWDEIFDGIKGAVDIVAFQDGHVELHELADYFSVNRKLADKHGMRSWTNAENFDRDMPIKFLPIKWEKLRMKLEAARAAGVEKAITFEFSHFMSPQSAYLQAGHLFNRYMEYAGELKKQGRVAAPAPSGGQQPDPALYAQTYREELLERVLPFWMKHSRDEEHGGYFTCLERDGKVFDTDKFTWLQGREVWTFSKLYNQLEQRPEWLEMALHGARFLQQHGMDENGNWYFALNRQGRPLVQAYNIFSDCFATMAFGQLATATRKAEYADLAKRTFLNILQRQDDPKGPYNKAYPGSRPLKNFALPMILCNLTLEIEHLLEPGLVEQAIRNCIHEVMEVFYDEETGLTLENVTPEGRRSDSFDGRLLNPGHAIEAMWFIMDLGERLGDKKLIETARDRMLRMLEYGWDEAFGGIFYFLDIDGHPVQQLEWDQKLWWVHLETLVALLKGYRHTGDMRCWQWFERLHHYTWPRFSDPEYGEWFGYLNRTGEVLLPLKGGKWKGCFHVPRGLYQCWSLLNG